MSKQNGAETTAATAQWQIDRLQPSDAARLQRLAWKCYPPYYDYLWQPGAMAADMAGTWEVGVREYGGRNYYISMQDGRLIIEEQGGRYSARFNHLKFEGAMQKDGLHLACNDRGKACGELVVQVKGDQISGRGVLIANPPLDIPVTVAGRREAAKPGSARTYDYNPQGNDFSSYYTAAAKPVLRIYPGDTVRTRTLDNRNMVCDFSDIKRIVKGWIDRELDHKMILRHDDPLVKPLQALGEPIYLLDSNPTVERIAKLIFDKSREQGLDVVAVRVWETPTSRTEYSEVTA